MGLHAWVGARTAYKLGWRPYHKACLQGSTAFHPGHDPGPLEFNGAAKRAPSLAAGANECEELATQGAFIPSPNYDNFFEASAHVWGTDRPWVTRRA
jgi:hypothetical protein